MSRSRRHEASTPLIPPEPPRILSYTSAVGYRPRPQRLLPLLLRDGIGRSLRCAVPLFVVLDANAGDFPPLSRPCPERPVDEPTHEALLRLRLTPLLARLGPRRRHGAPARVGSSNSLLGLRGEPRWSPPSRWPARPAARCHRCANPVHAARACMVARPSSQKPRNVDLRRCWPINGFAPRTFVHERAQQSAGPHLLPGTPEHGCLGAGSRLLSPATFDARLTRAARDPMLSRVRQRRRETSAERRHPVMRCRGRNRALRRHLLRKPGGGAGFSP